MSGKEKKQTLVNAKLKDKNNYINQHNNVIGFKYIIYYIYINIYVLYIRCMCVSLICLI